MFVLQLLFSSGKLRMFLWVCHIDAYCYSGKSYWGAPVWIWERAKWELYWASVMYLVTTQFWFRFSDGKTCRGISRAWISLVRENTSRFPDGVRACLVVVATFFFSSEMAKKNKPFQTIHISFMFWFQQPPEVQENIKSPLYRFGIAHHIGGN